jgi:hypothetical protein
MALADVLAKPVTPLEWLNRLIEVNEFDTQEIAKSNRLTIKGKQLSPAGRMSALRALKEEKILLLAERAKLTGESTMPDRGVPPGTGENPPAGAGESDGDGPKEPVPV